MMPTINIGIFAHVDAGKTTLTEALLLYAGALRKAGSVDEGTTSSDYTEIEKRRGISVSASSVQFAMNGFDINLIDTPGHIDFASETSRTLRAVDCALLVVSAVEGVQAGTETVWRALDTHRVPTAFFINKIDRVGADPARVIKELSDLMGNAHRPLCLNTAANSGTDSASVVPTDAAVLAETAAGLSEKLMERYFDGALTEADVQNALREAVYDTRLMPVLCGSAKQNKGISELARGLTDYMPNASGNADGPIAGLCYKLEHTDAGKAAHVRLFSGSLENRSGVLLQGQPEKITQIRRVLGRKYTDVGHFSAGQVAVLWGLGAKAGDILGDPALVPPELQLAEPLLSVKADVPGEQFNRLTEAAAELNEEDPLLRPYWVKEKRELTLSVTGKIQLEILTELFKTRYGLDVTFGSPSVIYRETPSAVGYGYDAYTMPKPCWAILKFLIEPLPAGSGVQYSAQVENNRIFYRYQSQVADTIPEALRQGPKGWQVTDLRITLVDGNHHTIHTHPLDFAVCTHMAMMNGLSEIGTDLLEPIQRYTLTAPDEDLGKLLGEIIARRGDYELDGAYRGKTRIVGTMPVETCWDFADYTARATGGRGILTTAFECYRKCPPGTGATTEYRGISPLDRAKYILWVRKALTDADMHL